jgi:hypothetical protein
MCFFAQVDGSSLYAAAGGPQDGWLGYLLPTGTTADPCIELQPALTDPALKGSFVFTPRAPDLSTPSAVQAFVTRVQGALRSSRGMVWLADPAEIPAAGPPYMGIDDGGTRIVLGLTAPIIQAPGSSVIVLSMLASGMTLALDGEAIALQGTGGITFGGTQAPQAQQISSATLPMSGPYRGCFRFGAYLQRQSMQSRLSWGFQFLFPAPAGAVRAAVAEYLPLADGALPNSSDLIGFDVAVDPNDPLNTVLGTDRTAFVFTGQNFDATPTTLASFYRTSFGAPVTLVPVPGPLDANPDAGRLVFHTGVATEDGGQLFQAAPQGDFVLAVSGARADAAYDLMCGVQGTEFTSFQPAIAGGYAGDRLRFAARQAAYAPRWPFQAASPVGPPVDAQAPLLETKYLTSWGTLVRASGTSGAIPYVAQPRGASLYGRDALIHNGSVAAASGGGGGNGFPTLFGALDPSVLLPEGQPFPLGPYGGYVPGDGTTGMDVEQSERFEREVVGPTRRLRIGGQGGRAPSKVAALSIFPAAATDAPFNTTTPTGLLVTVDGGTWTKVLLGQNYPPPPPPATQSQAASGASAEGAGTGDSPFRQMYFCRPNANLQQALQTGQLFMVAANSVNLGDLSGAGFGSCGLGAAFYNRMNVEAWDMAAQVGQENRYDDYSNVMIVKGRKGPLYDPTSDASKTASLVSNPDQWTQKDQLAAPSDLRVNEGGSETPGDPDPNELPILSGWLQRYFQAASEEADAEYFATFNRIAKDPNWTGILVLRMKIAHLPDDLSGIMAGVAAPELFFAHHLAIEISPVANDPTAPDIQLSDPSSIFGLIYYVDPAFTPPAPGQVAQPVPPPAGTEYDFRLLTLKVLFQNTAVLRFQSWAQLTLNTFFGMKVTRMGGAGGNPYNTLVLSGAYQSNNGKPLYSLATQAASTFFFDNNVVRKIEVQSAAMSTLNPGNQPVDPTVISWFALTGLIDFRVTWQKEDPGDGSAPSYYPFDVFSFGSDEATPTDPPAPIGDGQLGRGLAFNGLGVRMSFPAADTNQRTFAFVTDQVRFDVTRSTPRTGSLFQNFALEVQGITGGTKETGPSAAGFLTVIPDAVFTGVEGSAWTGIRYGLNLGSPGALAGGMGLTSQLLTGWAPGSTGDATYQAVVGLQLPGTGGGAKLISLQNVLKLSIGQLRLARDRDQSSFLLMMTEIALRFLGLLKIPPSGSTLFYLFGNPRSDGKPSGLGWYAMYKR